MRSVSPFENADAWDALAITILQDGKTTTHQWAGVPVDFDGDLVNEYDVQKPKGADGGRAKDLGYIPAQITVKWLLHRPEHYTTYESFLAIARPQPGRKPKPVLVIAHPMLQLHGLSKFFLEKAGLPAFKEVDQWEVKLALVQWFEAPKPVSPAPPKPPREPRTPALYEQPPPPPERKPKFAPPPGKTTWGYYKPELPSNQVKPDKG